MNRDFWRGRRVLLTGHTGFKGSWLSLWLQSLGAELTGLALPPPAKRNLFQLASVADGMESLYVDVRDAAAVAHALNDCRPEIVVHMAAQSLVQDSYERPVETFAVNVMGTVHVLEAARHCGSVRAVLNVTSDKCYQNSGGRTPYCETDPLGGHDPYSSSKGCAELVTSAYRLSFLGAERGDRSVGVATARAGNVIGGGDWARNRLVPDLLTAFAAGTPATIRNPSAIRPWQHVMEPLRGYLLLAERLWSDPAAASGAWNFGPDQRDAVAVGEVARRLAQLWGDDAALHVGQCASDGQEAPWLTLDAGKARAALGWNPLLGLDEALRLAVAWARDVAGGADARSITLAQLASYMKLSECRK